MKTLNLKDIGGGLDYCFKGQNPAEIILKFKLYCHRTGHKILNACSPKISDREIEKLIEPHIKEEWTYRDFIRYVS